MFQEELEAAKREFEDAKQKLAKLEGDADNLLTKLRDSKWTFPALAGTALVLILIVVF